MRVAYLVNQYPMVSLTFIRREIRALEAQGIRVDRFSIRPWRDKVVDSADREELAKTRFILSAALIRLPAAVLAALLTRPMRFFAMLALAARITRDSDRNLLMHLAYLAEACVLLRWLRQSGSEHLHAHFATNPAEVAMFCNGLGGPPYSFTVHGPEEFDRAIGLGYSEKVHRAKFVAAISEFCRSQLFRWSAYQDWEKIRIVRCGLDHSLLGSAPSPVARNSKLVCVGRLCEQKGHMVLLEAVARLRDEGLICKLVLVGDGEMRAELEALVARFGLAEQVRVTGWVSNRQVREEILAASALVLPSFAEGLPVVIMEAMALGRPVISTYIAGIPELVRNGDNGWLVPAGDVSALSNAMREALTMQEAQLRELAAHGRAVVEVRHNVDIEASKLIRYFAE